MPKQRITKEMVVDAAFEIARNEGMEKVMVKTIADKLGCSVQPIYSYCKNMDSLRRDVTERARHFIQSYLREHIDPNNLFQSTGRAYVQIAKEEPHIFKLYILQKRENISSLDDLYRTETNPDMAKVIAGNLNLGIEAAKQLHLNMLIYTIGIGTIMAVATPGISEAEIFHQQEQAYQVFSRMALEGKGNEQ